MSTRSKSASPPKSASSSPNDDARRNPRRDSSKVRYAGDDDGSGATADNGEEDSYDSKDIDDAEEDDPMEVDEEDDEPKRGRNNKKSPDNSNRRSSSRSNRFQASLKEPSGESIQDLFRASPSSKIDATDASKIPKSPAVRHKAIRRQVKTEVQVATEDDWSNEDEEADDEESDDGDDEDELKVQRIIASKSERRSAWKTICEKINTSEIESGSRWYEDDDEDDDGNKKSDETFEERFLVKWDDLSYLHCSWETQEDLVEQIDNAKNYLTTFFRKSQNGFLFTSDERCDGDFFDPAYTQIERILSVELPEESKGKGIIMDKSHADYDAGTGRQLLVKWGNTPYSDCTYEFERDLILNEIEYEDLLNEFFTRSKKPTKSEAKAAFAEGDRETRRLYKFFGNSSKLDEEKREKEISKYQKVLADKVYPNGGQLRDYQAEGVSWMMANYVNDRSSLLADEMGLGKTLQTCSFINLLSTELHRKGPILVVAPLSTLEHWKREFQTWTGLNTIVYHGSAHNREQTRELEFAYEQDRPRSGVAFNSSFLKKCFTKKSTKAEKLWMVQVVITTPEMIVTDDYSELTAVEWDALVVDEAHRLKNHASKLATNLRDKRFTFNHKLLLTGTPIQNNMTELWTLLNIIDPNSFDDLETFIDSYGDMKSKEGIDELHENIRPYILRRLKEDVEKSVPPKEETLIEVELTTLQKQYYRALYEKNVKFLHRNKKKALDGPSISNLAMQLRKCCNHPFLLNGVEEDIRNQEKKDGSNVSDGDFLVKASGKLVLLDKLLPRLKADGHRVLVFSQFKIMLDILEDYFIERKFKAERIDGSITGKKRQMAIDRFQSAPSEGKEAPFVMMLSTRAGGVGINLTAADTCIIFDSDWNPQNDLQAQARCHRIGQTKSVKVYRLLTRKTYEMQMFHMSSLKMGLDQAVLQGFESDSKGDGALSKEEVEKLLRHGAYDIFNEEKAGTADAESNAFIAQDLDSILERRAKTVVHENTGSKSSAAGGTFSKASFKVPSTPDGKKGTGATDMDVDIDDPDFWKKMVGEAKVDDVVDETGKKRKRKQANYSETAYKKQFDSHLRLSESDDEDDSGSDSDEVREDDFDEDDADDSSDTSGSQTHVRKKRKKEYAKWGRKDSQGWKRSDADTLVKSLHAYGYGNMPWEEFRTKCELNAYDAFEIQHMSWSVILTTLHEVTEENVAAYQRKLDKAKEKAAQKRKLAEEANPAFKQAPADVSGGVLGMRLQNEVDSAKAKQLLEHQFQSLVQSQASWLPFVLNDAKAFGMTHPARPQETVDRYLASSARKNVQTPQGKNAVFAQNLWPQLKNRGWKVEQVNDGGQMSTKYSFGGETYKSPEAVMLALVSIHPELASTVDMVQQSLAMLKRRDEQEKSSHLARIASNTLTLDDLERHLHHFAPLQLLVDRGTSKRLGLVKRLLTTCATLFNAHDIVLKAKTDTVGVGSPADKIAQSLMIDKRMYLPLPRWTANHDAVLILAIAKHGWIEHDACCRAITADKTTKWGPPFDGDEPQQMADITSEDDNANTIVDVAKRVAKFFTTERETLDSLKDFKEALLVKSYCLKFMPATEDEAAMWDVDENTLRGANSDETHNKGEVVDLPTKKELVKRAKTILAKRITLVNRVPVAPQVVEKVDHGYQILDVKDPANVFLAEVLRLLIKVSFNNSGKRRQLGRRLMNAAINEAKNRAEDIASKTPSNIVAIEGMKSVCEHCSFANRYVQTLPVQAKNVIRAMLGLPLVTPKTGSSLFPPVRATLTIESLPSTNETSTKSKPKAKSKLKKQRQKKNRNKGASGDIAISNAMAAVANEASAKAQVLAGTCIQLSAPETLLLTVVCSQGLPIWTDNWHDLIDSTQLIPEKQGPGFQNAISWWGMGQVFEAAANVWHHTAFNKLQNNRTSFIDHFDNVPDTDVVKINAKKKLEVLEQDENRKRLSLAVAGDYKNNPEKLAKKCIMLLESLRNHMGPVESIIGKSASKIAKLNKSENGLGPFVLEWLTHEIRRWAESLKLVDAMGHPLSYTASDFTPDDRNGTELHAIAALMDRKSCRTVFSQVAQQSRVREVFLRNTETGVKFLLRNAIQDFADPNQWDYKPRWWGNPVGGSTENYSVTHDFAVLDSLLEYGYSGIEETLAGFKEQQGFEDGAKELLTRSDIQLRANQLARALHILERTQRAILEVEEHAGIVRSAASLPGSIQSYFGSKGEATAFDIDVPVVGKQAVDVSTSVTVDLTL